ncbi:MAG: hypothetical protein SWC40_04505, partial [Thermodesulfobacteriota bacterium]|nr:hypothetical protein [Thermodesulfobacteriota bacterium]
MPAIRVNAALPVLRVAGKPAATDNGTPGRFPVGAGLPAIRVNAALPVLRVAGKPAPTDNG